MALIKSERSATWPIEQGWPDERIDRVFREMFRDFFGGGAFLDRFFEGRPTPMRVEEYLEDGMCVIRAELPGVDPDRDIELTVTDDRLLLRAHREERTEQARPDGYHSEFQYGSLQRSIRLPEGVTAADVKAVYTDGILEIRVPMPSAVAREPARIAIERS